MMSLRKTLDVKRQKLVAGALAHVHFNLACDASGPHNNFIHL